MIASFPIAAGVTGGAVPAGGPPGTAPAPAVDGFDALLGQLSAALLATAAEARAGDGSVLGPASASHVDEVANDDHDAVDSVAALAVVSPLPLQAAPHVWLPATIDGTEPESAVEDGLDAVPPHAGGGSHGAWPAVNGAESGFHADVGASLGTTAAPDASTGMHGEEGPAVTSDSASEPLPIDMPLGDAPAPSRSTAPLPFEQLPHERPIGRRAEPGSAPASDSAASVVSPTAIAPARSSVVPRGGSTEEAASAVEAQTPSRTTAPLPFERLPHERPLGRRAGTGPVFDARGPALDAGANAAGFGDGVGGPEEAAAAAPPLPPARALGVGAPTAAAATVPTPPARVRALAGALAARLEQRPDQAPPPGLVAQAGRAMAAFEMNGPKLGNDVTGTRLARGPVASSDIAGLASVPVVGAAAIDAAAVGIDRAAPVSLAIGPPWRAALAAADGAELAAPAPAPSAPMSPVASLGLLVRPPVDDAPAMLDAVANERPTLDASTGESVHGQIVRSLRLQWSGTLGEARVTLRPEFLGEVVATIAVDKGVVSATLQADTPEVRRWMEAHTTSLRDALVEHGLRLDRLTVAEPPRESADADRQGRPRGRQPETPTPRPRRRAAEGQTPQFDVTP